MPAKAKLVDVSRRLTQDLGLEFPPIQISFLESPPSGLSEHAGKVPSWCTFWAEARAEAFYVSLGGHSDCEIGAYVLGIPLVGATGEKLGKTLAWMQQEGYLVKGEEADIPQLRAPFRYVAYGPLGQVPAPPSVVVIFANPASTMVALEAHQPGMAHPFGVPVTGRPACAVIPTVLQGEAPVAMSLGCSGFRTYVEPGKDKMLLAVRGDYLVRFAEAVHRMKAANDAVQGEMERRKSAASC
jgi:uncharacterized protein (DUF169 family)